MDLPSGRRSRSPMQIILLITASSRLQRSRQNSRRTILLPWQKQEFCRLTMRIPSLSRIQNWFRVMVSRSQVSLL